MTSPLLWRGAVALACATMVPNAWGQGNPHLRSLAYQRDALVELTVAAGYQAMVAFASDEQVETIAVGDPTGWKVDAGKRGDFMFVKLGAGAQRTNLAVVTTRRTYQFVLVPAFDQLDGAVFSLRFTYDDTQNGVVERVRPDYKFTLLGAKSVRPASIREDGRRTYMTWPDKVPLPALYRIDDGQSETLANGYVENGAVVIDGVPSRLIFRLGNQTATAIRKVAGRGR